MCHKDKALALGLCTCVCVGGLPHGLNTDVDGDGNEWFTDCICGSLSEGLIGSLITN